MPAQGTSGTRAGSPIARRLRAWFAASRRDLPWRRQRTPYGTLVSELMLQQTTVAAVVPYFERFMARFPSVAALADASEDEVLALWSGLGYYSRARNLHRSARTVVDAHGGEIPGDVDRLRALPGVGPYTAAAIAAIAFDVPAFALDGNAARVVARVAGIAEPIDRPQVRAKLTSVGTTWLPRRGSGDLVESVMELGATVCTARAPLCSGCPVADLCVAHRDGRAAILPVRAGRPERRRVRVACARIEAEGHVLLLRRPSGLLAGTWALPEREIRQDEEAATAARAAADPFGVVNAARSSATSRKAPRPGSASGRFVGRVVHVFTHREVLADVFTFSVPRRRDVSIPAAGEVVWVLRGAEAPVRSAQGRPLALSSFARKLLALGGGGAEAERTGEGAAEGVAKGAAKIGKATGSLKAIRRKQWRERDSAAKRP